MFTKEQNVTYTGSNTATRTTGDEGTVAEDENSLGMVLVDFYGEREYIHRDNLSC
jgi:hypothetical protein